MLQERRNVMLCLTKHTILQVFEYINKHRIVPNVKSSFFHQIYIDDVDCDMYYIGIWHSAHVTGPTEECAQTVHTAEEVAILGVPIVWRSRIDEKEPQFSSWKSVSGALLCMSSKVKTL